MNSVLVFLLFFVLLYQSTYKLSKVYPQLKPYCLEGEDAGIPLFLTSLIENKKIEEARTKAAIQHKEMGNVSSYSGYFTVNNEYNSNLFFWFFPAMHNSETAPLVLWLQGGPGGSSMIGLFLENGPFIITANKTLKMREYSWTLTHNVIYIDNPVGTGYSFTDNENGYARNQTQIGKELLSALVQFFLLFPELQNNDFFVTGESYAGKYVPAVSYAIKNYNIKAKTKINLKGLAIGNGICDPENQLLYSNYLYQIGLIDLNGKAQFQEYEQTAREFIKRKNFIKAFEIFDTLLIHILSDGPTLFHNLTGFDLYYNYLTAKGNNDSALMSAWIQKVDVRYAIHVGNNTFHVGSRIVREYLKADAMQSIIVILKDLLEHYRVLIYSGQLDIIVAYPLTENYLQKLEWPGAEKYAKALRKLWRVENDLAGYTKSVDNLTEVLVRNAGHMAPRDQPKWVLDLITRFTHNKEF